MSDRLDRLIADAAACLTCGKEHVPRSLPGRGSVQRITWGDPDDGHPYNHDLEVNVEWLRAWSERNPR